MSTFANQVAEGIPSSIPDLPAFDPKISRAPVRKAILSDSEKDQAVANALRYFPQAWHGQLSGEFRQELETYGRIYMHRFRPTYEMTARSFDSYPGKSTAARAIMLMIQNNLDPAVAQHPYELITYGGNGAVFQNWAQYRLTMKYLSTMTDQQTLVMYSGHPMGLFPSSSNAPRVVVTNGMVIPNYSSRDDYEKFNALGVSQYGQMTAGSFMYIGPQGIVHGTTITILGAGRRLQEGGSLAGKLFVSSGLGGMSGAQGKACVIAGAVGVIAEIDPEAAEKRLNQGWVDEVILNLDELLVRITDCRKQGQGRALAYLGNVVDLWQYFADNNVAVDIGSDQTSCHNPFGGGYYPQGLTLEESRAMMAADPDEFRRRVHASLVKQVVAINRLTDRGMYFFDYGNAFLLEASRAGADVMRGDQFRYASYVEDIMGPVCFDYGFGPFRWVCASGEPGDLAVTDALAGEELSRLANAAPEEIRQQYADNLRWIREAQDHRMVVGSQARILYADATGRIAIARAFNQAIRTGQLQGPVVLGRDHHDVSGTDSPFRETANIRDGSKFTADMAVQNFVGDAMRGASWVSLHNGGGVGWGEVINGGFGLVLDGSEASDRKLESMLFWDVLNGIARRAWAGNSGAKWALDRAMADHPEFQVLQP